MSGETGIFDVYGFELTVSAAEKADRYACAEYALRREAKWEPFVKSQCLPEGAKLKRYVRKVGGGLRGASFDAVGRRAGLSMRGWSLSHVIRGAVLLVRERACARVLLLARFFP
jgi:hypothetical protein